MSKDNQEERIMIYFLQYNDLIKIGYSRSLPDRLQKHNRTYNNVSLIGSIEGNRKIERILHNYLKDYNVRGEWFKAEAEVVKLLETLSSISYNKLDDWISRILIMKDKQWKAEYAKQ